MKSFGYILIIFLIIFSILLVYNYFADFQVDETIINIKKGSSASQIANILHSNHIIRSRLLFALYVRINHIDKNLSYGRYHFKGDLSLSDVSDILTSARIMLRRITIPEGLSLRKTCRILSNKDFGSYNNFISLCTDSTFASHLVGHKVRSLEGYLFPETYMIPEKVSEEYILKTMVDEFFRQTKDLKYHAGPLDSYSTLILASIVEREAHFHSEMPLIAGVYLNRLDDNHKLQADPTVAYILDEKGKKRKKIYYKDLRIDSPFNTYKYTGLPPAPICSPGLQAIKGVISPQNTDYYFFFASSGGKHEFSRTYSEHLRKQNELKKINASR